MIFGNKYIDYKRYYRVNGDYKDYESCLDYLELNTLIKRREILTGKFAIDTAISERHEGFFETKSPNKYNMRANSRFKEKFCRTKRYSQSAIPYMSKMLNNVHFPVKK